MRTKFNTNQKTPVITTKNNRSVENQLVNLTSTIISRARLSASLGRSFDGKRDLYEALGYSKNLQFEDYEARYHRQDVAKRIVNAFPDATWRMKPEIIENEEADETEFEKAWNVFSMTKHVFHYLRRVDRLAGIHRYGSLLYGFDDHKNFNQPANRATDVLYFQPYTEQDSEVVIWETDKHNPRFGLPLRYSVTIRNRGFDRRADEKQKVMLDVHWTRLLHVADDREESDVFGVPRMEAVFNRLQDMETVVGSGAEMWWRGAFPGYVFTANDEAELDQDLTDVEDEIEKYIHKFQRYLRVQGIKVEQLAQQIEDPSALVDVFLKLISAGTGIPLRILTGSERGELASSQDKTNWNERVDERRKDFAEPVILRPFIDNLIRVGVLPTPKDGIYIIRWPDIDALTEKDQADLGKTKMEILKAYLTAPGAEQIIPPMQFLTEIMGFSTEQAQTFLEEALEELKLDREEDDDEEEEDEDEE